MICLCLLPRRLEHRKNRGEGSINSSQTDVQRITSTPGSTVIAGLHGQASPMDTSSSPGNAKHDAIQPHFITISSEDIQRIADAVKATLGDEIKALVENEETKAVQPTGCQIQPSTRRKQILVLQTGRPRTIWKKTHGTSVGHT